MSEVSKLVYYRQHDYVRVIRRIPSMLIDFVSVFLLVSALAFAFRVTYIPQSVRDMPNSPEKKKMEADYLRRVKTPAMLGFTALALAYHIALRRTRGGTLGYRLLGIRLIDATGQAPPWKVLVKRFFIAVPLFFFFAATYWGCFQNPRRQALHDTLSGTWLVRKNAQAAGLARPAYQTKLLGTWLVTYLDLEPIEADASVADRA
jgi:uncharacterized RDD family membrane protein YckC